MPQAADDPIGGPEQVSTRPPDVVVIAASAGGLAAISEVLSSLPAGLTAPVVVVQHLDPRHRSLLAEILRRRTALRVEEAAEGSSLERGTVYVAPPGEHTLIGADRALHLSHTEPVHFVRPSADVLFESAAAACGDRITAVVLTGTGTDGNMGVRAVAQAGGSVICQDPSTAEFPGMPEAAIETGRVDLILPLSEIGPALVARLEAPDRECG